MNDNKVNRYTLSTYQNYVDLFVLSAYVQVMSVRITILNAHKGLVRLKKTKDKLRWEELAKK